MRIDVKECARLLLEQDDILILTHAHPDGDTLGCGFALCRALLQKGKFAYVKNEADIPPKYNYLFDDIVPIKFTPRGADVAIEASDMVIQGDSLSQLPVGVTVARKTVGIARENIIFAIAVKLLIILGCAVGIFDENAMWLAVFGDVGVCLLAVANALRVLHIRKKKK